jgi:FlaA1/EpsC-like NDP-sugar epimerase
VRYGNVFGSRGSIIPILLSQKENSFFSITDKRMTRFSITLDEAINFVFNCISNMKGSEIFVPKIPSYKILDLTNAIDKNKKIKFIGIRPGEKLHEEMITVHDSIFTIEKKRYFIIYPKNEAHLKKLIYEKNEKNPIINKKLNLYKVAFYLMTFGINFKNYKPISFSKGYVKESRIDHYGVLVLFKVIYLIYALKKFLLAQVTIILRSFKFNIK